MDDARRLAWLILCGVIVLVLSIVVFVRSRRLDEDLLAAIGLVGGVAIVLVALPRRPGPPTDAP